MEKLTLLQRDELYKEINFLIHDPICRKCDVFKDCISSIIKCIGSNSDISKEKYCLNKEKTK